MYTIRVSFVSGCSPPASIEPRPMGRRPSLPQAAQKLGTIMRDACIMRGGGTRHALGLLTCVGRPNHPSKARCIVGRRAPQWPAHIFRLGWVGVGTRHPPLDRSIHSIDRCIQLNLPQRLQFRPPRPTQSRADPGISVSASSGFRSKRSGGGEVVRRPTSHFFLSGIGGGRRRRVFFFQLSSSQSIGPGVWLEGPRRAEAHYGKRVRALVVSSPPREAK